MNIIGKSLSNIASTFLSKSIQGNIFNVSRFCINNALQGLEQVRGMGSSLFQMHRKGLHKKDRPAKRILNGKPFAKGVVLKTLIKKPKKPNSANRKCVLVRLSTGRELVAYVPGIGHNLQEHNIVLCRVGKLQDTPGVKVKCVRGAYDLPHVVKQHPK